MKHDAPILADVCLENSLATPLGRFHCSSKFSGGVAALATLYEKRTKIAFRQDIGMPFHLKDKCLQCAKLTSEKVSLWSFLGVIAKSVSGPSVLCMHVEALLGSPERTSPL